MPTRTITAEGLRDLFAEHTDSSMFGLVTFYTDDLTQYAPVVNNTENITHNGTEYIGVPFQLTLAPSNDEQIPTLNITVDNVARELIDLIRSVTEAPPVTVEIIRVNGEGATTTELGPMDFSLLDARANLETVTLVIGHTNDILNSPATKDIFNPGTAPALFSS